MKTNNLRHSPRRSLLQNQVTLEPLPGQSLKSSLDFPGSALHAARAPERHHKQQRAIAPASEHKHQSLDNTPPFPQSPGLSGSRARGPHGCGASGSHTCTPSARQQSREGQAPGLSPAQTAGHTPAPGTWESRAHSLKYFLINTLKLNLATFLSWSSFTD